MVGYPSKMILLLHDQRPQMANAGVNLQLKLDVTVTASQTVRRLLEGPLAAESFIVPQE